MKRRVVAVGLDSVDPDLLTQWFAAGELPNLARLKARGTTCRFENTVDYTGEAVPFCSTEGLWVTLQTGVKAPTSGYWGAIDFDRSNYIATANPMVAGYAYRNFAPFYALGDDYRVAVFDLPISARVPNVNGVQIVGWGGHFPLAARGSTPESLLAEITERYGSNEVLDKDSGVFWDPTYLRWLEAKTIESIATRTRICLDLIDREQWDLLLAVFGETHGASHDLWFASDPAHPLHAHRPDRHDPLLNVFRAIDRGVGEIARRAGPDVNLVCFSAHGMQSNSADLANFFLLPELLYRYNFPGQIGFAPGDAGQPLPPQSGRDPHWFGEIWRRHYAKTAVGRLVRSTMPRRIFRPSGPDFDFPYELDCSGPQLGWMPAQWYRPSWPRMRSFALPAFADGHVRLNVVGREGNGLVDPSEYDVECQRVANFLLGVTNARTGCPVVKQVLRTRRDPLDPNPHLPHFDLAVQWDSTPFDVVDGVGIGRIGPVPYYRTGGHKNAGFMIATGPDVATRPTIGSAEVVDFAPTILDLLGAPIPVHYEGRSLAPTLSSRRADFTNVSASAR